MKSFKMHEAKTHLSKIVEMVEAGETVELKRRDKVVARVVPPGTDRERAPRQLGGLEGVWPNATDVKTSFVDDVEAMFGLND